MLTMPLEETLLVSSMSRVKVGAMNWLPSCQSGNLYWNDH